MQALLVSTAAVAIAEIGDKTQLLSLILAAKYRKPVPIALGILVATLANHALAGLFGALVAGWFSPQALKWIVAASFLAIAAWTLVPDKVDDAGETSKRRSGGVFVATLVAFFLAEMGDKTQVATVALAAQYQMLVAVVAGTTLGMMIANVPAVLLGDRIAARMPVKLVHGIAAAIFLGLGIATLAGAGESLGF